MRWLLLPAVLCLAACDRAEHAPAPVSSPSATASPAAVLEKPEASAPSPGVSPAHPALIAEREVLAQWSRAENRASCVALAFSEDDGAHGAPRRAYFGGGWAVAFDLPGKRSAYGLAGVGLLPHDDASDADKRATLLAQWPYFRDLGALPAPSFAGYGVEGASVYSDDDPQGLRANSLAYVRVGGQRCMYNVWSRLGRRHLETLLDGLRVVGKLAG